MNFDEALNEQSDYPKDFSQEALKEYIRICGITTNASARDILVSLNVAEEIHDELKFTNAGVLFFAKDPQKFFPESYITAIKYKTDERFSIIDNKDFKGSPIIQIEGALNFILRHMSVEPSIMKKASPLLGARHNIYEYSPVALREAVVNAITHRDYLYDSSHIYIHMFPDYIEIENPGGLYRGLSLEDLGKRTIRRNRLIADLLHRAGYIERVGSGFSRMKNALTENNNPPFQISATNFFNIRFYKRLSSIDQSALTSRQYTIYQAISNNPGIAKRELAALLHLSEDTTLRELNNLIKLKLVSKTGAGKSTTYGTNLLKPGKNP